MATKAMPIQLANAIVAMLGEEDFSLAFTAKRRHLPYGDGTNGTENELEKLNGVSVLVVLGDNIDRTRAEQSDNLDHFVPVFVCIYSKLVQDPLKETTEVDEFCFLAEEIEDVLEAAELTTESGHQAIIEDPIQRPVFVHKGHLETQRMAIAVLNATYKVFRADPAANEE